MTDHMGITDSCQALIMAISMSFIGIGALNPANFGFSPHLQLLFVILGIIGVAIKEKLGSGNVIKPTS